MTFGDVKRTTFRARGVATMEFCLGCGNDLPLSTKERRNVNSDSTGGVVSAWSSLMMVVLGHQDQDLSVGDVFADLNNSGKMCKNCYKVYDNLAKKCAKLKDNLVKPARRACKLLDRASELQAAAPVTPVTPSRKRRCVEGGTSSNGSPAVMVWYHNQ